MVSGVAPACGVWMLACVLPAREGGGACRAPSTPRLPSALKLLSSRSATPRQATEIKPASLTPRQGGVCSIFLKPQHCVCQCQVSSANYSERYNVRGKDVVEVVGFEEDASGGGEEVVEEVDGGEVLEEGGHVFHGGDEA